MQLCFLQVCASTVLQVELDCRTFSLCKLQGWQKEEVAECAQGLGFASSALLGTPNAFRAQSLLDVSSSPQR